MSRTPEGSHFDRCIALIGLRGAGKTAVGRALAALAGRSLVDLDDAIVLAAGTSIALIFEREGEAGFRQRERDALFAVLESPPGVLALGGGAVLDPRNVKKLREQAIVIWLTAPPAVLAARIAGDERSVLSRPSLTGRLPADEMETLATQREGPYRAAADYAINTDGLSPAEIAEQIVERLGLPRTP